MLVAIVTAAAAAAAVAAVRNSKTQGINPNSLPPPQLYAAFVVFVIIEPYIRPLGWHR
jgi:hypothetical protein